MRHLVTIEGKNGFRYYWTPPSKLRSLEERPPWLKNQPLGASLPEAISAAESFNAKLDAWRGNRRVSDGISAMVNAYLMSPRFAGLSDRSKADYRPHLDAIRGDFAGSAPDDVTPAVVATYQDALARKGLSPRQLTYRLQVLRLLFAWGKSRGHVAANPAAQIDLSTRAAKPARIWTLDAINEAMNAAYPVGLAAALALFTLQRQGDILRMKWSDIDHGAVRVIQGKTRRLVILPIHPHLQAALNAAPRLGDTILATHGRPYSESGFRAIWRRRVPSGSPSFHDIRRTATTWLSAAGLSDETVMLWTGHGRTGSERILDVYDRRLGDLSKHAFPVMDGWRVQSLDSCAALSA